jgi:hypothetical protein
MHDLSEAESDSMNRRTVRNNVSVLCGLSVCVCLCVWSVMSWRLEATQQIAGLGRARVDV